MKDVSILEWLGDPQEGDLFEGQFPILDWMTVGDNKITIWAAGSDGKGCLEGLFPLNGSVRVTINRENRNAK